MPHHVHPQGSGPNPHDEGIEAHVVINLAPGVGIDEAVERISAVQLGTKDPGHKFDLMHLHVALGAIDLLADVQCKWTQPMGRETYIIGEWVSAVRQLKIGDKPIVASTSTSVCMNVP
jgi:hypothetical protein